MSQLFSWGGLSKLQEIEQNTTDTSDEIDVVLVNGKRVKCAPGIRFSDKAAVSMAQQAGWILSWSKIEALERTELHFDWISKAGMEPKLLHFTNNLLKLEQSRMNGEKMVVLPILQLIVLLLQGHDNRKGHWGCKKALLMN